MAGADTPLALMSGAQLHRRIAAVLWACAPLVVGDALGRAREAAAATGCSVEEALPYEVSLLDVHSHHVPAAAAAAAAAPSDAERRHALVSEDDLWAVGDAQHVRIVWRDPVAATAFRDATAGRHPREDQREGCRGASRRPALTLDQCLRAFVRPESLRARDERTGLPDQPCTKTLELWRAPPLLIVQLKRFAFMGLGEKLETRVEFPLRDLDLSPCMRHGRRESGQDRYDLFAVVNHFGSLGAGHYTAFVREGVGEGARWWECDDRCVACRRTRPPLCAGTLLPAPSPQLGARGDRRGRGHRRRLHAVLRAAGPRRVVAGPLRGRGGQAQRGRRPFPADGRSSSKWQAAAEHRSAAASAPPPPPPQFAALRCWERNCPTGDGGHCHVSAPRRERRFGQP